MTPEDGGASPTAPQEEAPGAKRAWPPKPYFDSFGELRGAAHWDKHGNPSAPLAPSYRRPVDTAPCPDLLTLEARAEEGLQMARPIAQHLSLTLTEAPNLGAPPPGLRDPSSEGSQSSTSMQPHTRNILLVAVVSTFKSLGGFMLDKTMQLIGSPTQLPDRGIPQPQVVSRLSTGSFTRKVSSIRR